MSGFARTALRRIVLLGLIGMLGAACGSAATNGNRNPGSPAAGRSSPTAPPPAVTISNPSSADLNSTATPPPPAAAPTGTEPTNEPEVMVGPHSYPEHVNPLTGQRVSDPALLLRRPLAIKVSNFPRYVRPQSGLSVADMVWEHYAEGGTSRFTAIYLSSSPDRVGPIRSARLIDTVLPEMLDGALVTSGSSTGTMRRLSFKSWFGLVISEETGFHCPPLCRESEDTNAVYASTEVLWQSLAERGLSAVPEMSGLAFFRQPPSGGQPGGLLRVDYSGEAHTEWRYNAGTNRYDRWVDASATELEAHMDEYSGVQIAADNVVVLFVNHVVDFAIPEDFGADGFSGHFATEIQLWGTGPALIFRNGQTFEATWVRLKSGDMLGLVDPNNAPLPLHPGQTWFQTVGLTSPVAQVGSDWMIQHRSPRDQGALPGVDTPTPTPEGFIPSETPPSGEPSATPPG